MKQTKTVYNYDDLLELLSEHAIGTDTMKNIEQFVQRKQDYETFIRRRLAKAEELLGANLLDEHMMYD